MDARFSDTLRATSAEPVWTAIFAHPFLKELAAGTLSEETFRFYICQDCLFLEGFARAVRSLCPRPRMLRPCTASPSACPSRSSANYTRACFHSLAWTKRRLSKQSSLPPAGPTSTTCFRRQRWGASATQRQPCYRARGPITRSASRWARSNTLFIGPGPPSISRGFLAESVEGLALVSRRGVPGRRRGAAKAHGAGLPHEQPLRVTILGDGLEAGALAGVKQSTDVRPEGPGMLTGWGSDLAAALEEVARCGASRLPGFLRLGA